MNTFPQIAAIFRQALARRQISQAVLRQEAGLSQRTLTKVLSGHEDYKLSTLLALADRLGLELLLVPKEAAATIAAGAASQPMVKSRVQQALETVRLAAQDSADGDRS